MPRIRITRELHFSAAHRLHNAEWSDERNLEVFGGCGNPNWHGHNYELFVTVEGEIDPPSGFVMDLRVLRDLVNERIVDEVDHKNLNLDVPWMKGTIPSTENFVVAIWDRLVGEMPDGVRLAKLTLGETPRHYVEYEGD
jgi:6-pyruvoyltetrahydropterin/6-carboxytetrahydropterin synthase